MIRFILAALLSSGIAFAAGRADAQTAPGYCYGNNGLSYRSCDAAAPTQPGEVWFRDLATPAQLAMSFPAYVTAAAQQAQLDGAARCKAACAAGLSVASAATPVASGEWSVADDARTRIERIVSYIQANGKFSANLSSLPWRDLGGTPHQFSRPADFVKWAAAVNDYLIALDMACDTAAGGAWLPPTRRP